MGSVPDNLPHGVSVDMATQPGNPKDVAMLLNSINTLGASSLDNEQNRLNILKQARLLVQALETPRETMIKHLWAQPATGCAIASGVESGLFDFMARNPGSKTVAQLAAELDFEKDLLARSMRHLASTGYLRETGVDEYETNHFSRSLTLPIIGSAYSCVVGGVWPTFCNFPTYLKKNERRMTPDIGPLQDAIGSKKDFFTHIMEKYPAGEFQQFMKGYGQGRRLWMDPDFYPVVERLVNGADTTSPDAAFIVDIGGGIGHDLDEFCRKQPAAPGRHVLQDLPHVLSQAQVQDLDSKIELMPYDFNTEQPVKGARAYYLHSVLHDWTDEVCESILARVKAAMRAGYSRLLINENVIPSKGADWQVTALDMVVMTVFASRERTEEEWYQLLEGAAGLSIVKIWSRGEGSESLIECELA
ncbi:O-methyltransferase [Colletotrichum melonis]|uniref:O-methyltransferase n=1 Tax=Colletotrichum melonis TaxID=1209925 RepID=A0AAI9XX78_9PEZI|nr:O-methyltransferase [Colletotrichum melonis]